MHGLKADIGVRTAASRQFPRQRRAHELTGNQHGQRRERIRRAQRFDLFNEPRLQFNEASGEEGMRQNMKYEIRNEKDFPIFPRSRGDKGV